MTSSSDTVDMPPEAGIDALVAKYFGSDVPNVTVDLGGVSNQGKVRTNNEDHFLVTRRRRSRDVLLTNLPKGFLHQVEDEAYTLAVADGIGGAAFGELASMFALRAGWDWTARAFNWNFQMNERESQELMEKIQVYGKLMHQALQQRAQADPQLAGMGTTITGAVLVGADAFLGHAGDSRAYLFHDGSLRQITRDHTQAQLLVDAGLVDSLAHAPRIMRHILVNCLGGTAGDVHVDVHHLKLTDGDRLLLCTDGLSDMVSDTAIAETLQRNPISADACRALVELALEHGGRDNVTVVLARIAIGAAATPD